MISLGTTLFSVGIGFAVTVLPTLSEMIEQDKFNAELIRVLENHTGIQMKESYSTASIQVLNGVDTYTAILAVSGIALIVIGIVTAMRDLASLRSGKK